MSQHDENKLKKYDDWPVWRLWLAWSASFVCPGSTEYLIIESVIERKTAFRRCEKRIWW